jgi:hypothetical protein
MVLSALAAHADRTRPPLFLSIQGIDRTVGTSGQDVARAAGNATTLLMALLERAWPLPSRD